MNLRKPLLNKNIGSIKKYVITYFLWLLVSLLLRFGKFNQIIMITKYENLNVCAKFNDWQNIHS